MKTLILLLLLSSSVLYTGCHSKKMEKRKDIEISVINITTDQYPDEEIEIPIFIVYTFKVKNNKNTSIPFDFAWANFPREKEPEALLYGIYGKDSIEFVGNPVRVNPKSTETLVNRLDVDYLQKLYDNRDRRKFPDIHSFIRDIASKTVIYYIGKSDTCIVKPNVEVDFIGSDTTAYTW